MCHGAAGALAPVLLMFPVHGHTMLLIPRSAWVGPKALVLQQLPPTRGLDEWRRLAEGFAMIFSDLSTGCNE